ncbi:MAG: polysaccharide biosynthesis/export family protein [Terracidiphilus sp.]
MRIIDNYSIGGLVLLFAGILSAQAVTPARTDHGLVAATDLSAQPLTQTYSGSNEDRFVIGEGDLLAISVWKEPELSRSIPVRSDGEISLPLVGEVKAAGLTPLQLEQDIARKLRNYITEPEVTIIVEQINSEKFNILGQVAKPGSYPLMQATTVMDAIATAGGFRDFAKQKNVYVLRQAPSAKETRIAFNYKEYIKGKNVQQNIKLEPHDTIVVP